MVSMELKKAAVMHQQLQPASNCLVMCLKTTLAPGTKLVLYISKHTSPISE